MLLRSLFQNFKSSLVYCNRIQNLSTTSALCKRSRQISGLSDHRTGNIVVDEGAEGEKYYQFKGGKLFDAVLPTLETMNKEFDGMPFKELPILSIKCSKNNTRVFIYDLMMKVIMSTSSKVEGFKHCKKKTTVAGQATGVAAGLKALRRGFKTVRVVIRGLGPGRNTAVKGLTLAGLNVVSITDWTQLPEKGPRGRRQRHV